MAFVRGRRASAGQVCLKIVVADGEVCAGIRAPADGSAPLKLDRVPLRKAIVIAACLAERVGGDVLVVDRHGLWPE